MSQRRRMPASLVLPSLSCHTLRLYFTLAGYSGKRCLVQFRRRRRRDRRELEEAVRLGNVVLPTGEPVFAVPALYHSIPEWSSPPSSCRMCTYACLGALVGPYVRLSNTSLPSSRWQRISYVAQLNSFNVAFIFSSSTSSKKKLSS